MCVRTCGRERERVCENESMSEGTTEIVIMAVVVMIEKDEDERK